jgi:hypothetical protein
MPILEKSHGLGTSSSRSNPVGYLSDGLLEKTLDTNVADSEICDVHRLSQECQPQLFPYDTPRTIRTNHPVEYGLLQFVAIWVL